MIIEGTIKKDKKFKAFFFRRDTNIQTFMVLIAECVSVLCEIVSSKVHA